MNDKTKSIICTASEVRAYLENRKTQFRVPTAFHDWERRDPLDADPVLVTYPATYPNKKLAGKVCAVIEQQRYVDHTEKIRFPAPFAVGDIVRVKEMWSTVYHDQEDGDPETGDVPFYLADYDGDPAEVKWNSAQCIPAKLSRIWLRIKGVRQERLREISVSGIASEGIVTEEEWDNGSQASRVQHIERFYQSWDAKHPKHPSSGNPWVFAFETELIERLKGVMT